MKINVSFSLQHEIDNYLDSLWKFKWEKHGRQNIQERLLGPFPIWFKDKLNRAQTEKEARTVISEYIKQNILTKGKKYKDTSTNLENVWESQKAKILAGLESIYGYTIPFKKLTVYLTSIPICPYSYKELWIMVSTNASTNEQLNIISHELNHFMFYYYFPQLKKRLGIRKYESLKEALTVFTNPEEKGYPSQKKLRGWLKTQEGTIGEILENEKLFNLL